MNTLEKILVKKGSEIQARILGGFDTKMRELRGMIKDTSGAIDVQVKALEQITKDEKRKTLEQLYAENIGELKDLLPLTNFFRDSWLNVTVTIKKAEAEMVAFIDKVRQDLAVINSLNSEFALQIKDHYLRFFDISGALIEKERLEQTKKKLEVAEGPTTKVVDMLISKEAQAPVDDLPWANVSDKPKEFTLALTVSLAQLKFVKSFLYTHRIKFREIL